MRKCGGILVIVATFLGLLFVCRQLIKASDSSVKKSSKYGNPSVQKGTRPRGSRST